MSGQVDPWADVPPEYAWIKKGVMAQFRDADGAVVHSGPIAQGPFVSMGQWCARIKGVYAFLICGYLSPAESVEGDE